MTSIYLKLESIYDSINVKYKKDVIKFIFKNTKIPLFKYDYKKNN